MPSGVYPRPLSPVETITCPTCRQPFVAFARDKRKFCNKLCQKSWAQSSEGRRFQSDKQKGKPFTGSTEWRKDPIKFARWQQRQKESLHGLTGPKEDLTGKKFHRLTVVSLFGPGGKNNEYLWNCVCECGNTSKVVGSPLKRGDTKSCGCILEEWSKLPKSEKTKKLMSIAAQNRSEESRIKNRQSINNSILSGKYSPQLNRKGKVTKLETKKGGMNFCDSTWEIKFVGMLEDDLKVLEFEKDKVRIPYSFLGKTRVYIVDFLVTYVTGYRKLIEIKPKDLLEKDEMPEKFKQARNWCKNNNAEFIVLTEDNLYPKKEN